MTVMHHPAKMVEHVKTRLLGISVYVLMVIKEIIVMKIQMIALELLV